jgi:hypothetical protein
MLWTAVFVHILTEMVCLTLSAARVRFVKIYILTDMVIT